MYHSIMDEFRNKRHDLLDFHHNRFDRDYVEFNVRISDLESALQQFINQSFETVTSVFEKPRAGIKLGRKMGTKNPAKS